VLVGSNLREGKSNWTERSWARAFATTKKLSANQNDLGILGAESSTGGGRNFNAILRAGARLPRKAIPALTSRGGRLAE